MNSLLSQLQVNTRTEQTCQPWSGTSLKEEQIPKQEQTSKDRLVINFTSFLAIPSAKLTANHEVFYHWKKNHLGGRESVMTSPHQKYLWTGCCTNLFCVATDIFGTIINKGKEEFLTINNPFRIFGLSPKTNFYQKFQNSMFKSYTPAPPHQQNNLVYQYRK